MDFGVNKLETLSSEIMQEMERW